MAFFLIYSNISDEKTEDLSEVEGVEQKQIETPPQEGPPPIRYFSAGSDKIVIGVSRDVLYTDDPSTSLSYYALDNSGQLVHFRGEDRAFSRVIGVSHFYNNNTEIFHPTRPDGSIDDTVFLGNINLLEPGTYLIKICLGKSINLNSEGIMVWPWGCFEDDSSQELIVYAR